MTCYGGPVSVFAAAYAGTRQGSELVSSSNAPFPEDWDRVSEIARVPMDESGGQSVNEIRIDARDYRALAWYWYEVDGQVSATGTGTKLRQSLALLQGRPAGGRIVVLETPVDTDYDAARNRLSRVAEAMRGTNGR